MVKVVCAGMEAGRGVLSATGSWQLLLIRFWIEQMDVEKGESFTNFIRKIKLMIKASLYWRFYLINSLTIM